MGVGEWGSWGVGRDAILGGRKEKKKKVEEEEEELVEEEKKRVPNLDRLAKQMNL